MYNNPKKIRLFRGDKEEIDQFDFSMTNKRCLVGQGIYLTDKQEVADTYRVKGIKHWQHKGPILAPVETIFEGEARDRNDAIEKSFERFCARHEPRLNYNGLKANQKKQVLEQLRALFEEAKLEGRITAEYRQVNWRAGVRYLVVKYNTQIYMGEVSVFAFPEREFNDSMLHVYKIADPEILGLFFDAGLSYGTPYAERHEYVKHNTYCRWSRTPYTGPKPDFAKIRRIVEPFGFRGFEYDGGLMIGGFGRHRAFCVWNDEWVNAHRIDRI